MSLPHRRTGGLPGVFTAAYVALALGLALPGAAVAQGGMGGGFGSPGGGMGEAVDIGMGSSSNSTAPNVSKHFEDLYSLKEALKHVDALTKDQKSGFDDIEHSYEKRFKSMGHDAQQIVDSAHVAHERPDRARLDTLRQQAAQLRAQEWSAARSLLSTDPQRDRFDANLAQIRADDAKREEEMQQRMSGGQPGAPS